MFQRKIEIKEETYVNRMGAGWKDREEEIDG